MASKSVDSFGSVAGSITGSTGSQTVFRVLRWLRYLSSALRDLALARSANDMGLCLIGSAYADLDEGLTKMYATRLRSLVRTARSASEAAFGYSDLHIAGATARGMARVAIGPGTRLRSA